MALDGNGETVTGSAPKVHAVAAVTAATAIQARHGVGPPQVVNVAPES